MQYPFIERQLLTKFRLVHGVFNACVMVLFFYHASIGLAIRRARRAKAPLPFSEIKRHRKMGPFLALAGVAGCCAGLILVLVDTGNVLEYTPHFIIGSLIVFLLIVTFIISRNIKGQVSPLRTPHAFIGIAILFLYIVEVFLGFGVLL
jgi:hypothetical protein